MKIIAIDDKRINHLRLVVRESGVYQIQRCNPTWKTISEHKGITEAVYDFLDKTNYLKGKAAK